eukprot:CAMPEP_0196767880 /NCGR_PEP_ID=MMETSP1095-20130614/42071_1 /TAXON_ID=96789 ORGANISM="Chromulina nebulosa, Strain UTEXLB2642" /NCGR_SAMPLE_ID=MMETSP1095 /ASSEMBLY_ACC=CAM_ASM_000446 /LENGTH=211 /DNA_ID=CAMNT_0042136659 /DNA_START=1562 /DNA_END=2197 /DNA_ORIENTATION=-
MADKFSGFDEKRKDFMNTELSYFTDFNYFEEYNMTYNSNDNPEKFLNELMGINVTEKTPIKSIKPNNKKNQDPFDIGLVIYQGPNKDKLIILIELKSPSVMKDSKPESDLNEYLPGYRYREEGRQYFRMIEVICNETADYVQKYGTSNLTIKGSNSMTNKKFEDVFQYVYATTLKEKSISKWGAIKLVEEDMKSFFSSPFWGMYESIRSVM